MRRYNNSYRMMHYNRVNICDAICTINEPTYSALKANKYHGTSYHGNGVVKTVKVHDFYDFYEAVREVAKKYDKTA